MRLRPVRLIAVLLLLSLAGGDVILAQRSRSRGKRAAVTKKRKTARSKGRVSSRRKGRATARSRRRGRARSEATEATPAAAHRLPSGIPTERVIEIQTALGKRGYYEGEPSGEWDERTIEAMKRFQAANRLPETGLPSAHTLQKLGVSKTSKDGYSVPIKSVSQNDKTP